MDETPQTGIQRAAAMAGGGPKLAQYLGVTRQNVHSWNKIGFIPPLDRVREVATLTGIPHIDLVDPEIAALFPELKRNTNI